jgi:hypothetical protein
MMLIEYQTLRIWNPQVDMSSHLVDQLYHENPPKNYVSLDSWWNQEFLTLDKALKKAKWIWNFVKDILYWPKLVLTICVHCDSHTTIKKAQSSIYNGKSRHIHHKYNTIKHLLWSEIISIDFVKSKKNIVDPLTKGFLREFVYNLRRGTSLKPLKNKRE